MISEINLAMQMKTGLDSIACVIYPYPIQSDTTRMFGDLRKKTTVASTTKGLLSRIANRSLS